MTRSPMSRRTILKGATALGALVAASGELLAQQRPAATLPPRNEFIIRGATMLTMDPGIGDLASGDVHVRDGAIVAVAPRVDRPNVRVIEGSGMICTPGFIDTHWHLWTSIFRPFVRADVNEVPLLIGFILVIALLDIIMPGALPKWAIFAPIFVPLFINLGVAPQTVLAAYRIGDSPMNVITPLMVYLPFIVLVAQRYKTDAGLGTIISLMLPYTIIVLASWLLLFIVWYLIGIPMGPGYPVKL